VNCNETLESQPKTADELVTKWMGGPPDLVGNVTCPSMLRVEVGVRDLYHLCGPEWKAVFEKVTKNHQSRVQAGHATG
jgi:hypothetical protein